MRRAALLLLVLLAAPAAAGPRPGFGWPLPGTPTVERGFAPPKTAWGAGHRGVDLTAYGGELVLAAGPGRVTYAGLLAGRGVVTVTHSGGLRTTYEPVTASVHVGQAVARGTPLGRVGTGHLSCRDVCLHWGLLRGDTYLDPRGLLVEQRVRLLPLGDPAPVPLPALRTSSEERGDAPVGLAAGSLASGLAGVSLLAARRRRAA